MMIRTTFGDARRAARVLLLAGALAPALMSAQGIAQPPPEIEERIEGPSYGHVSLLFTQSYDDNIFAVQESLHPQSDLVSRFGPTFEVGRNTRRLRLSAKYGMAAERYLDRFDLNSDIARQDGSVDMRYHVTPRTQLHVDGGYIDTQSPRDINIVTLLVAGRTRAERLSAHGGVSQSLTQRTTLNADYNVTDDTLAERLRNLSHAGRVGLGWQATPRASLRVDYRPRRVEFGNVTGASTAPTTTTPGSDPSTPTAGVIPLSINEGTVTTQVISGGFTYAITPLTSLEVDAGPRFSESVVRPEIAATVRRRTQRSGELSATYISTQETSFGEVLSIDTPVLEAGFYEVQRVSAMASISPNRHLTMSATPAFARSKRLDRYSDVRELTVDITVHVLRRLSFIASGRVNDQPGTFTNPNDPIRSRLLSLTTQLTLP